MKPPTCIITRAHRLHGLDYTGQDGNSPAVIVAEHDKGTAGATIPGGKRSVKFAFDGDNTSVEVVVDAYNPNETLAAMITARLQSIIDALKDGQP